MIIEDLIRMGMPLHAAITSESSIIDRRTVLEWVGDVANSRAKNFFRNVIIVEIGRRAGAAPDASLEVQVLPRQEWVQAEGKQTRVDLTRAWSTPFVMPVGGNPLNPQGAYPAPVYLCYDKHLRGFAESAEAVTGFLAGRLERTISAPLAKTDPLLDSLARKVHEACLDFAETRDKQLGLLVLARCTDDPASAYEYLAGGRSETDVGLSRLQPGRRIELRSGVAGNFLAARTAEGRDAKLGKRAGACSFCGRHSETLLPPYCKAWPWFSTAWSCPVPEGGARRMLIEGPAMCERCYQALVLGASVVSACERTLLGTLTAALFSPVADRRAREKNRRPLNQLPAIHGMVFLTPLMDRTELDNDENIAEEYVEGMMDWIESNRTAPGSSGRHPRQLARQVKSVLGFEHSLPQSIAESDAFRLTLLYYSGDRSRGDVHIRALIQEVLPSTIAALGTIGRKVCAEMAPLARWLGIAKEGTTAPLEIVPLLLARAYGHGTLWQTFQKVLHRAAIDPEQAIHAAARRFESLARTLSDGLTWYQLREETLFLLTFLDFGQKWRAYVRHQQEEPVMLKPWKTLLEWIDEDPESHLIEQTDPGDLGFLAGAVVARFGAMYYNASGGKDFLSHRVLTFGSGLGHREVRTRALAQMLELEHKLQRSGQKQLHLPDRLRGWIGVLLAELGIKEEDIARRSDDFLCGFWAGYAIGRSRKKEAPAEGISEEGKRGTV